MTEPAAEAPSGGEPDDQPAAVEVETPTLLQKLSSEVIGTFVLVFFGCGTALVSGGIDPDFGFPNQVSTGLSFGLAVVVMAYAVGRISGGHFNPAVTVGAAVGGRLAWREVGPYVGAQLAGAIGAALSLWIILSASPIFDSTESGFATNGFGDFSAIGLAWWGAFLLEALMTFLFLLVILAVTDARNQHPAMAPLAIGVTLAMIHFASIGATGTSVNPARSIAPALFAGTDHLIQLWLFILAPLLGAAAAGLLYPQLFGGPEPVPGSGLKLGRGNRAAVPGYGAPDAYQQQWNQQQWPQQTDQHPQQTAQFPGYQQGGWDQQGYPQQGQQQAWDQQQGQQGYPQQYGQQYGQQYDQQYDQQGQQGQQGARPQPVWDPQTQQWQQPQADDGAQQWGQPASGVDDDEDGRTQIRPHG